MGEHASRATASSVPRPAKARLRTRIFVGIAIATLSLVVVQACRPDDTVGAGDAGICEGASCDGGMLDSTLPSVSPSADGSASFDATTVDGANDSSLDAGADGDSIICDGGAMLCNGACVDTTLDNGNCGACNNTCTALAPSTAQCSAGRCQITIASNWNLSGSGGIAVDESYVYWTGYACATDGVGCNPMSSRVMKAPIGGGPATAIASGITIDHGLAVDSAYAYWGGSGAVYKVALDGGPVTTLATASLPVGIALDSTAVYWAENATTDPTIRGVYKVALDGGAPLGLATNQNLPDGDVPWEPVTVATNGTNVYFLGYTGGLTEVPCNGGTAIRLLPNANGVAGVAVDSTNIYFADPSGPMKLPIRTDAGPTILGLPNKGGAWYLGVDTTNVYYTTVGSAGGGETNGTVSRAPIAGGPSVVLATGQAEASGLAVGATSVFWTTAAGDVMQTPK